MPNRNESITKQVIKSVSKLAADTSFRALGFRKQSQNLVREQDGLFHCIQFQASRWGSADEGQFTINLTVPIPVLYEAWTGKAFPKNPTSGAFGIGTRIGHLMPENKDLWWSVDRKTDIDAIPGEVVKVLAEYAVPYFDRYPNVRAAIEELRGTDRLGHQSPVATALIHAVLASHLGHDSEARHQIDVSSKLAGTSPFASTVRIVAERAGIEMPGL